MAQPSEKLADSLSALKELKDKGAVAIRTTQLSRTHRQRLLKAGFIREVMKGWYTPTRPDEPPGESTGWYASPGCCRTRCRSRARFEQDYPKLRIRAKYFCGFRA